MEALKDSKAIDFGVSEEFCIDSEWTPGMILHTLDFV